VTRAASRNRRWMQGSLKRKLSREERENNEFNKGTQGLVVKALRLKAQQERERAERKANLERLLGEPE
jgi:hypothetical protein